MRKIAVAAAVLCGLSSSLACAQSSVTLYGVFDTGIEYVSRASTATSVGGLVGMQKYGGLSASRWGLRGEEDLGDGLKASFWLESGFTPGDGKLVSASQLFYRQAAIGLTKSGFGKVSLGRQYTSLMESMVNFLPFKTSVAYEPANTIAGAAYREDNMVKYTGDFGSTHVLAHYSFGTGFAFQGGQMSTIPNGEVPGNSRAQAAFGGGVYYLGESLGVAAGYDQINNALTATSPIGEDRKAFIAASYETGPIRFMGGYRWRDSRYGNGVTAIRDNIYWAGMSYSMTPAMKLIAGYYYDQVLGASLSPNTKAASLPNFSQFTLMGTYSLSKRTTVYLVSAYAYNGPVDYDTLLQTGASYGYGNPTTLNGLANGQKSQVAVAAGLRVIF